MRITELQVLEGALPPKGYGYAWRDYGDSSIWMPIPFNLIARFIRAAYRSIAFNRNKTWIEKREIAAYQAGFEQGKLTGVAIYRCTRRTDADL